MFGDRRLPKRFWDKVKIVDCVLRPELGPCWEWIGAKRDKKRGYGNIGIGSRTDGTRRSIRAHRFAYESLIGPIPEGLEPDHLCRNPCCVNPAHLELVTHPINVLRGLSGAHFKSRTHCPQGHPYDEENTIIEHGYRVCHACRLARDKRRHAREKEALQNGK